VKKLKPLADAVYEEEIIRLSGLKKFPELPSAQQELRRALRRISATDEAFLHRLITDVVDSEMVCPTPAELIQRAGAIRHRGQGTVGRADCPHCQGSGFVSTTRTVTLPGMLPYDSAFAALCVCRGGK
jgi:hypothetical protein